MKKTSILIKNILSRRFFFLLLSAAWQALRGGAALLLLIFLTPLMIAICYGVFGHEHSPEKDAIAHTRSNSVCGKLSGTIIEVSRKYILLWPEYEGRSSWEKGFTKNKKGCDANLTSITMTMAWPELLPLSLAEFSAQRRSDFNGIVLSLKPTRVKNEDMSYALEGLLGVSAPEIERPENYIEQLGLYSFEKKQKSSLDGIKKYMWYRDKNIVPFYFICGKQSSEKNYADCSGNFKISEIGALAEITVSEANTKDWKNIVASMKKFALSKIKSER
jgi:hypothetical protein